MIKINETIKEYKLKVGTKNGWKLINEELREIDEKTYSLITNTDTMKFFRRLGGSETVRRGYTCNGYTITKLSSISPDKTIKLIREYQFSTNLV